MLAARNVAREAGSDRFQRRGNAAWARTLRVPPTRLYNALSELGLEQVRDDDDLRRVVQYVQRNAIAFSTLAELFGPETTLFDLMRGEVLP